MKFTVAVIFALIGYSSANAIGQVVDVAHSHSAVGSHGPALVNSWGAGGWGNGWNAGLGGWNGGLGAWNGGLGAWNGWNGVNGWAVGSPIGAPLIGLKTTGAGIIGGGVGIGIGIDGHSGQYVASNRGAVHVAPLTGHIQSVKSSNLQPAPGTIW